MSFFFLGSAMTVGDIRQQYEDLNTPGGSQEKAEYCYYDEDGRLLVTQYSQSPSVYWLGRANKVTVQFSGKPAEVLKDRTMRSASTENNSILISGEFSDGKCHDYQCFDRAGNMTHSVYSRTIPNAWSYAAWKVRVRLDDGRWLVLKDKSSRPGRYE